MRRELRTGAGRGLQPGSRGVRGRAERFSCSLALWTHIPHLVHSRLFPTLEGAYRNPFCASTATTRVHGSCPGRVLHRGAVHPFVVKSIRTGTP